MVSVPTGELRAPCTLSLLVFVLCHSLSTPSSTTLEDRYGGQLLAQDAGQQQDHVLTHVGSPYPSTWQTCSSTAPCWPSAPSTNHPAIFQHTLQQQPHAALVGGVDMQPVGAMDYHHAQAYAAVNAAAQMHLYEYPATSMHSPPAASTAASTPTSAVFASHSLPANMLPPTMPMQAQQQQHNMNNNHNHQQAQSMSPLFHSMHQLQQQQQQQQHSQQQQQPLHYQPEASTSGSMGMSGAYVGTPLIESSGPASPDESISARDRRASKKGTKRPRPTLSCTECVRRKSKCDRVRGTSSAVRYQ